MEQQKREFEVKEKVIIPDGLHDGVIIRVEYREQPYKYTDIFVMEATTKFELKYGCPTNVSMDSKLGKLLGKFVVLKPHAKIIPEDVLIGQKVSFQTIMEEADDGRSYTRIVDGSIKPK